MGHVVSFSEMSVSAEASVGKCSLYTVVIEAQIFLNWYSWGVESNWVQSALRPPIVPAPGGYDDGEIGGMMIGRGN
jgi:hypothetical protein